MKTLAAAAMLTATLASGKPVQTRVPYSLDGKDFEGVLVFDDSVKAPRPGILMVPNWLGVNDANLKQAALVAGKDYVVFVADVYGKGVRPTSGDEAGKVAGALKADRPTLRAHAQASLKAFLAAAKVARVDTSKIGAVGFCFGGTTVNELAKSGAEFAAAVSIHGGLDAPLATLEKPKARLLALHGADDPFVPRTDVNAFTDDLRKAGADWTFVEFSGAVHSFTDVDAKVPGKSQYDERTAQRAYAMMRTFFSESFRRP